jgi:glutaminase
MAIRKRSRWRSPRTTARPSPADAPFSAQSITKVFMLTRALEVSTGDL